MIKNLKKYSGFYIPYFIFVVVFGIVILFSNKADLHIRLNSFHTPFLDFFFRYYTNVGASIPYFVAGALAFYRYRNAIVIVASQLFTGLVEQIIKHVWNLPRPALYFAEHYPNVHLPVVSGVHVYTTHSFPSGHTTAAFSLFILLVLGTKNRSLQFLYFILAFLVGFSRIYLSEHFPVDVWAGSLIGVFFTLLLKDYLDRYEWNWANGSLRDVLKSKNKS